MPLFQQMISNFHQPSMKSWRCQYRLPSHGDGETPQLNLLFVIQGMKTVTFLYGLITEINLEVDTETSAGRGESVAPGKTGIKVKYFSNHSLCMTPAMRVRSRK